MSGATQLAFDKHPQLRDAWVSQVAKLGFDFSEAFFPMRQIRLDCPFRRRKVNIAPAS
jgi:hypothetical protein